MLFLAHRKELIEQARQTFRHALHDGAFGELLADGDVPMHWNYVFATIQSAASHGLLERMGPDHFRYVVVDECHHAPSQSYRALIPHLRPEILLGLTATPERSDGNSLLPDFEGHVAAELRVWHALERQLLVPFEYYGISDNTDLSRVRWKRNGYDLGALDGVYTGNEARVDLIVRGLQRRVSDLRSVRALAFCVSVEHAEFMAQSLTERGIAAMCVHGNCAPDVRRDAPRRLREREVNVICTCDLYNEGVDLPYVDVLLLLRPTQSATLFLQQLGRGLRHSKNKASCIVLDFIGQHRAEFRFDVTLSALSGVSRTRLASAVEQGFPLLPSGCALQLDSVARAQILTSLRAQLTRRNALVADLRALSEASAAPLSLMQFVAQSGRELEEIYKKGSSWTSLRREAGVLDAAANTLDDEASEQLRRLLHVDEPTRLTAYAHALNAIEVLAVSDVEQARMNMLSIQLKPRGMIPRAEETLAPYRSSAVVGQEFAELTRALIERTSLPKDVYPVSEWPLALHKHYTRFEIAAAVGYKRAGDKAGVPQAGILKLPQHRELLFVTLDKSAKSFSPTTRYRDYAISPNLFHWETQTAASVDGTSGRRYLESPANGWSFFLFVRTDPDSPYAFCGPVTYEKHEGDRPISITWRIDHTLPAGLYQRYATLAQG